MTTENNEKKWSVGSVMDLIFETQEKETGDGITDYTYDQGSKAMCELIKQKNQKFVEAFELIDSLYTVASVNSPIPYTFIKQANDFINKYQEEFNDCI